MLLQMGMLPLIVTLSSLILDRFGRGEAVVVIVIKLLEDAIRDGDKIYATVRISRYLLIQCSSLILGMANAGVKYSYQLHRFVVVIL